MKIINEVYILEITRYTYKRATMLTNLQNVNNINIYIYIYIYKIINNNIIVKIMVCIITPINITTNS